MNRTVWWAKHYQHVWHERTGDSQLPLWLRVAFLAYGSHRANGHARFKPGEIGMIFATVNPVTGEIKSQDPSNVQRAIRRAVAKGWLAEGSGSMCLVVPAHAIEGGPGYDTEKCSLHHAPGRRPARARAGVKARGPAV